MNRWTGSWADTEQGAVSVALAEVNVSQAEYVTCQFAEGLRLEPVGRDRDAIDVEIVYSETRGQFKAVLRRMPMSNE